MKKISLKNLNLGNVEQLSREELRQVAGGSGASCNSNCTGGCTRGGVAGSCLKRSDGGCTYGTAS